MVSVSDVFCLGRRRETCRTEGWLLIRRRELFALDALIGETL